MYFKILADDLCHNGFQYKEGLNVDTNIFDETPSCGGGLFFSDEKNIIEFCNYGNKIAVVTVPEGKQIVKVNNKFKSHSVIISDIRNLWSAETFKWLIENGADIHAGYDCALCWASGNGHLEVVKFLIENGADIHANYDRALRWASENGHLEVVKVLIENGADIHADDDYALRLASKNGHLEVVKVLLENGADIHVYDDCALRLASENGHLEVVKVLREAMEKEKE